MTSARLQKTFDALFARRMSRRSQWVFKLYGRLRPVRQPIFVIGSGRSGTSIFTDLMSRRSDIINWSEANEMWDPVGFPWQANRVRRPFEPIDAQGYADDVLKSAGRAYYAAIPGICAMYMGARAGIFHQQRFLNKSPMNTLRVGVLLNLFPDARLISIVRDPRGVIRSWMAKIDPKLVAHPNSSVEVTPSGDKRYVVGGVPYTGAEMMAAICKQYTHIVQYQISQMERLPPERYFTVRYEDFGQHIHETLRAIDRQFDLDPALRQWDGIPAVLENRNYKYRQAYSRREMDMIYDLCLPVFEYFGYERT